ncbi:ATP-dependent DNA helicase RecG [Dyadobacter sp. BE34]|uniref:ATP-dependent DNA helicase RecG n=1 Tax=Dyadobacter fermentans TaxID=94254 RepID=A0ABU1QRW3_9BACT|nr:MULTISPECIES: ATP-dependent DNA helicase RecG [Dyadobacter]MDR6803896.1 ATP-dependent DNA helicase RecG [Dyadobacter fermentans]MDR7041636.1 ATP-dependent DNA helicase RecG [Dyadobacter sp. BE242]MDR7196039.1 ATP-dependent DNA helicase RecG [Dyadobacter sp. BE34]MDR7213416.1 ATP-dependent DNA helicase RecG [Dyadobacter sp. BE31]MDR7261445.1 ATP-dependent DNA helicase RecG [Dyadobacter sp. BE32]
MTSETNPSVRTRFFDTKIEFLKGVGPQKAALLNQELNIFTFGDLIQHYPFRHEDRSVFHKLSQLNEQMPAVQVKGRLRDFGIIGEGSKKRLVGTFQDGTGYLELVWFQSISWYEKWLRPGGEYIVYGNPIAFGGKWSITHPEIEVLTQENAAAGYWQPIYPLTEKLRKKFLDSKALSKMMRSLLEIAHPHIRETLPAPLVEKYRLVSKAQALWHFHLPQDARTLHQAQRRLKFEELFYNQFRLIKNKLLHKTEYPGLIFDKTMLVKEFYEQHLPFKLTGAQIRVLHEIHEDLKTGKQMNRLLQGDVGSGKTIVAFITMLFALDNDAQACLMAPTEILTDQHYQGLKKFADLLGVNIAKLTGSTKKKEREVIHRELLNGTLHIIVGTHALIEDAVQFKNLGLCIIDEQHRFGVAQRAKLWAKNSRVNPHMLVMTATPIPRTLAMTLYGDLDISAINELPAGRKPIKTVHRFDKHRLSVFGFLKEEIAKGRQVYMVYPLIEESEKMDLKDLMDGYESVARAFPGVPLSIVHGKMRSQDKDFEMARFVRGETKIMVATTVIEVGVNVPNASVMVIENAERFGLSQLHQLRGRVGRGAEQSYCILMTDYKLSKDTKLRIDTMCNTNDGFEIAEVDLQLRGPGDISGTQQSGLVDLLVANLAQDGEILKAARASAEEILTADPDLLQPVHHPIRNHLENLRKEETNWSRIS